MRPEKLLEESSEYKLLRIQVERLMTSVIVFVITVDWLPCKANCQALLGWDDIVLSGKRRIVLSICMSWQLKSRQNTTTTLQKE